jgi:hypothetical protein
MQIIYKNQDTSRIFELNSKNFEQTTANNELITALPLEYMKVKSIKSIHYPNESEFVKDISKNAHHMLGLDPHKPHVLKYLQDDDSYKVFALDKSLLDISQYSYITYEPLVYQSLYENKFLTHSIDLFIKIKKNSSFVVVYKNGKYYESRAIDEFLKETLYKKYDLNFLKEVLQTYNENIAGMIATLLEPISSLIVLESSEFKLDIKRVFLDFDFTIDDKYFEVFRNSIDEKIAPLNINTLGADTTSAIYTTMLVKSKNQALNFINIKKSANNSGYFSKSAASIVIASAISLAYPMYLASSVVTTKVETMALKKDLQKIQENKQRLLSSVQKYVDHKENLENRLATLKDEKSEILAGLNDIYKGLDDKKAQILAKISSKLNITDVSIDNISLKEQNGSNIVSLSLLSKSKGKIDFVIKELAYLEFYKKSVYKYNDKYRANIEVAI